MKKIFLSLAVIGLMSTGTFAGWGIGYDAGLEQIFVRIPLGPVNLEPGLGFLYDDAHAVDGDEREFGLGVSATVLYPMWDYSPLTAHIMGGLNIQELQDPPDPQNNDDIGVAFFAGLQPEVTFWDHFTISTAFGLSLPLVPELQFGTFGEGLFEFGGGAFAGLSFMIDFGGGGGSFSGGYTPSSTTTESDSEYPSDSEY